MSFDGKSQNLEDLSVFANNSGNDSSVNFTTIELSPAPKKRVDLFFEGQLSRAYSQCLKKTFQIAGAAGGHNYAGEILFFSSRLWWIFLEKTHSLFERSWAVCPREQVFYGGMPRLIKKGLFYEVSYL